ncbi:hypothetical protein [Yunchengibacter salinarum]|uniref:hypothetical protein n=1 Tax=Yunchengibacter salinarum TaxID=3133399 RepID=UPI0035B5C585
MSMMEARKLLESLIQKHPELGLHGYGNARHCHRPYRPQDLNSKEWQWERDALLKDLYLEQFFTCCRFLRKLDQTPTVEPAALSTASLASYVFRWSREKVAVGPLIAAAHGMGFQVERVPGSNHARFNYDAQSLERLCPLGGGSDFASRIQAGLKAATAAAS